MSEDPKIIKRIVELLNEQYLPYVKKAVLQLEVYSGEKSKRAVHELRDALDHIAIAVHKDTTEFLALKSLNAVEEHFRRAAVEPIEWIALREIERLLKVKRKGFWWWRLLFVKPPDSKEFNERILRGQELIAQGRYYKGISLKDSYENLQKAYLIFHELLSTIRPEELMSRYFDLILALAMLVLGLILGKLFL